MVTKHNSSRSYGAALLEAAAVLIVLLGLLLGGIQVAYDIQTNRDLAALAEGALRQPSIDRTLAMDLSLLSPATRNRELAAHLQKVADDALRDLRKLPAAQAGALVQATLLVLEIDSRSGRAIKPTYIKSISPGEPEAFPPAHLAQTHPQSRLVTAAFAATPDGRSIWAVVLPPLLPSDSSKISYSKEATLIALQVSGRAGRDLLRHSPKIYSHFYLTSLRKDD